MREIRARHPRFREAVAADARVAAEFRGERSVFASRLDLIAQCVRLAWVSDAFLAQMLYRFKARGQALRIPLLPRIAHKLAMVTGQIAIGDPVNVAAGVYLPHGQVVIDGLTEIGAGASIAPFVTVGLRAGDLRGPILETEVHVGTGARLIGPIRVGAKAVIGAGAVVVDDVAPGATVAGVPARPL